MTVLLARADARALPLKDGSVQTCITSPPFWGLRSYETGDAKHLELGGERTPEEYVAHMVEAFREVRRVLRDDGTLWLEIGDCYCTVPHGPKGANAFDPKYPGARERGGNLGEQSNRLPMVGVKHKDLVGIPWALAFALRADGWYLRQEIIWHKPACMPESVTDRPTRAHSTVFLLAKSRTYYYDAEAVKEPLKQSTIERGYTKAYLDGRESEHTEQAPDDVRAKANWRANAYVPTGRNLRSVWQINTAPYKGAHYATFPPKLVEPCILAGTSAKGACVACGAPWERVVERKPMVVKRSGRGELAGNRTHCSGTMLEAAAATIGWRPTCTCGTEATRPCIVLDPFCGTATVARVAIAYGRRAVCFDLSATYLSKLATKRTHNVQLEMTP